MITIVKRFAHKDESEDHPYVVELSTRRQSGDMSAKQVHRFGDSHSRAEFLDGVLSLARLLNQSVDYRTTLPRKSRRS